MAFVAAVKAKYEHKVGSEEGGELVGGDKTGAKQALGLLTRVFVPDAGVDSPGAEGEVAATCGAIRELDIGGNGFDSWSPVLAIAAQLPKLHWLGLDRLPLAPLTAPLPDGFGRAVGGLRTLCVSGTGMAWQQLLLLSSAMPLLEELHFSANRVSTLRASTGGSGGGGAAAPGVVSFIASEFRTKVEYEQWARAQQAGHAAGGELAASPPPPAGLLRLHSLYLEENDLSDWADVEPLGRLPSLRLLNLNFNQLAAIPAGASASFATLEHLMLRANPISSWASIDVLDSFAALTEARLAEVRE